MKNLISTLFIFCLISSTLLAQNTISGEVTCKNGGLMSGVTVTLTGGTIGTMTAVTDASGTYTFDGIPSSEDYNIHLERAGLVLNGVSTYDMVLIAQAILNPTSDNSLFFLAADVNNTGTVTTLDIVLLREIILAQEDSFPVPTWRFATDDFDFIAGTGHVDDVPVVNLQGDLSVNFVGVHMGDVNESGPSTQCN